MTGETHGDAPAVGVVPDSDAGTGRRQADDGTAPGDQPDGLRDAVRDAVDWELAWEARWWREVTRWRIRAAWWAQRAGAGAVTPLDVAWRGRYGRRAVAGLVVAVALVLVAGELFTVGREEPALAGLLFIGPLVGALGAWVGWNALRLGCLWVASGCEAQALAGEARLVAEREAALTDAGR